jgi:hypothetical protein
VDTFSDRQERARAALARSSSQLRVLQKVISSQEMVDSRRMEDLPEYDAAHNDFSHLEPFDDDLQGGILISTVSGDENLTEYKII